MLAAWKWIKWGGLVGLLVTICLLWFALEASYSRQEALSSKLLKAQHDNRASQSAIRQLTKDNRYINQLLVERKQKQQQSQRKLENEIRQLKQSMANIDCVIPNDVSERLRQPY